MMKKSKLIIETQRRKQKCGEPTNDLNLNCGKNTCFKCKRQFGLKSLIFFVALILLPMLSMIVGYSFSEYEMTGEVNGVIGVDLGCDASFNSFNIFVDSVNERNYVGYYDIDKILDENPTSLSIDTKDTYRLTVNNKNTQMSGAWLELKLTFHETTAVSFTNDSNHMMQFKQQNASLEGTFPAIVAGRPKFILPTISNGGIVYDDVNNTTTIMLRTDIAVANFNSIFLDGVLAGLIVTSDIIDVYFTVEVTTYGDEDFTTPYRLSNIGGNLNGYAPTPDLIYNINGTEVTCSGLVEGSNATDIRIASTYNGIPVTSISEGAFNTVNGKEIESVVIPSSVSSIGASAFNNCSKLTSVVIPSSVSSIGASAFNNCSKLISVSIPDQVTNLGDYAFSGCEGLTSLYIGDGVTSISEYMFGPSNNLNSLSIGDGITYLDDCFFDSFSNLISLTLGKGITSLTLYNLYRLAALKNLSSLSIEGSELNIEAYAYFDSHKLVQLHCENEGVANKISALLSPNPLRETVIGPSETTNFENTLVIGEKYFTYNVGDKVYLMGFVNDSFNNVDDMGDILPRITDIGDYAFESCNNLTNLIFPSTITSIGENAFKSCTKLSNVIFPSTITNIGDNAFYSCTSLSDITIPGSVQNLGAGAFRSCSDLTSATLLQGVQNIGNSAFEECGNLFSISFPSGLQSIGTSAFYDCENLNRVTLPTGLKTIGKQAFHNCFRLSKLVMPDTVTEIGNLAFEGCFKLCNLEIPASVTSIGDGVFYSCFTLLQIRNLSAVTIDSGRHSLMANSLREIKTDSTAFTNTLINNDDEKYITYQIAGTNTVYLLGLTNNAITTADDISGISPRVTAIYDYAFYASYNLESVTIPEGVTSIGKWSFYGCIKINSLKISSTVESNIGENAFNDCRKITSLYINSKYVAQSLTGDEVCGQLLKNITSQEYLYIQKGKTITGFIIGNFNSLGENTIDGVVYYIYQRK